MVDCSVQPNQRYKWPPLSGARVRLGGFCSPAAVEVQLVSLTVQPPTPSTRTPMADAVVIQTMLFRAAGHRRWHDAALDAVRGGARLSGKCPDAARLIVATVTLQRSGVLVLVYRLLSPAHCVTVPCWPAPSAKRCGHGPTWARSGHAARGR